MTNIFNIDINTVSNKYIKLEGYFQHINYFKEFDSEIREIFKFDDEMLSELTKYLNNIKSSKRIVGIHIRLTNIPGEPLKNFCYNIPSEKFYIDAMNQFDPENVIFIALSNDIQRAMSDYPNLKNIIPFSGGLFEDMCLLSLCDDFILSPSTYGWWGCFLSKSVDKKIIQCAPFFNCRNNKDWKEDYDYYFENSMKYDSINLKFL